MLSAAQGAFVVTFGRAGEDKKFSKLGDVEATLQGFAGADYDLQVLQHILHLEVHITLPYLMQHHAYLTQHHDILPVLYTCCMQHHTCI